MQNYSTRQAAKKLGLHVATLARYIQQGKVSAPQILKVGSASLHAWSEEDIERVHKLLPKIVDSLFGLKHRTRPNRCSPQGGPHGCN